MGILADSGLILQAQPALFDGGFDFEVTAGTNWLIRFIDVTNASGAAINLAGMTGHCDVYAYLGGPLVTSLTFTGGSGTFTLSKDHTTSAGLANGQRRRACPWRLVIEDADDPLPFWVPSNSTLYIHSAGGSL